MNQSFVRNMAADPADLALCEAIIVMTHKLSQKLIAEEIETKEQLDLLKSIGCNFGRGYWFSKPIPGEEFEK
ncbi:EAL domain-containing protein [Ferrovum myxofaciens]|uniref:EAL domain-containing protein n=1 Tax=Ferrovum myxofaciens TaxID=416213 RepID=UPI003B5BF64E